MLEYLVLLLSVWTHKTSIQ